MVVFNGIVVAYIQLLKTSFPHPPFLFPTALNRVIIPKVAFFLFPFFPVVMVVSNGIVVAYIHAIPQNIFSSPSFSIHRSA